MTITELYNIAEEITELAEDYDLYGFRDCYALEDFELAINDTFELIKDCDMGVLDLIDEMIEDDYFRDKNEDKLYHLKSALEYYYS